LSHQCLKSYNATSKWVASFFRVSKITAKGVIAGDRWNQRPTQPNWAKDAHLSRRETHIITRQFWKWWKIPDPSKSCFFSISKPLTWFASRSLLQWQFSFILCSFERFDD